jgi:dTDP-4-dehydrorhamnose 3,5-epimerase-like enzyme
MLNKEKVIDLPKVQDRRGNLSFIESELQIPFNIKRVYWIYDVPGGAIRGGHAFKEQEEFLICISGSVDVVVHDGVEKNTYSLNRSYYGLYIPKMLWRHLENFSTNSVVLALSNTKYDPTDYIRDFEDFKNQKI